MSHLKAHALVSIITPVYNNAKFIGETINSVVNQDYQNWELILVNDCSTDSTAEVIESYSIKENRVKVIHLQDNRGAGFARNVGLEEAHGQFVAFLDGDDVWLPEKLGTQIRFLQENQSIDFIYCWYYNIDEKGNRLSYFKTPSKISYAQLKYNNYILTSTTLFRESILKDLRFSSIRKRQDWVFFLEALKKTPYAFAQDKLLVEYRKNSKSLSANRYKLIKPNFNLFREYMNDGNSLFAVLHFMKFLPIYFHNKFFNKKKIR